MWASNKVNETNNLILMRRNKNIITDIVLSQVDRN